MTPKPGRHRLVVGLVAATIVACVPSLHVRARATPLDTLPASISDRDFWAMTETMSEPNGSFQSDNMASNEMTLSSVAAALAQRVKPGGVYLGVGPEQNLTYIAASRPRLAFITDIRRGNLHMQLMYKALFELSTDRADFLSRLFTKKRPAGLTEKSSAADLMTAYWDVFTSDIEAYRANLQAITDQLAKTHGFPLSQEDLDGIAYVYHAFYWHGLLINYGSRSTGTSSGGPNYASLMMTADAASGQERGYLSTEENFTFLKSLESKNLLVPLVGDFGGPKALRAVGSYLSDHGAVVTAFYLSNVESYLTRDGKWPVFCANVAAMPLDDASTFIRPGGLAGMVVLTTNGTSTSMVNGTSLVQFTMRAGTNSATLPAGSRDLAMLLGGIPVASPMPSAMPLNPSTFGGMAAETAACKFR